MCKIYKKTGIRKLAICIGVKESRIIVDYVDNYLYYLFANIFVLIIIENIFVIDN